MADGGLVEEKRPAKALTPAEITTKLNPSRRYRLLTVLSFPLILLIGVPFWWYVTSIERLPLPEARISALEAASSIDTRTPIWFTADDDAIPDPPTGRATYDKGTVLSAIAREVMKSADGIQGQKRPDLQGKRLWDLVTELPKDQAPGLRLHLRPSDRANASFPLGPYVQAPETGLMTSGLPAGTAIIPVHPSQMGDRFLNKHYQIAMVKTLEALFPSLPEPPSIPLRALKYTPNVTLSFVLLNEDSSAGNYVRGWDIESALQDHIQPHLEPLQSIFNFTVESQILYHAPLSFEPSFGKVPSDGVDLLTPAIESAKEGDEDAELEAKAIIDETREEAWLISEEEMKIFVNSEQWSLDSGSSNNPVLRFLLFVPSAVHRPMRLALPDTSQSFLLPQYGSVALLGPLASTTEAQAYSLPSSALESSFHLFTQHFYALLALPAIESYIGQTPSPMPHIAPKPLIQPVSPWQIEQVMRMRTKENSEEARKTLAGIVRLVSKIKEMKLGEGVRGKVLGAVERLEKLDKTTDVKEAFILSRDAVALANEAFFDPSMMGLLYFPDEHKFAVYTPLFAPIAIPMIVGIIREFLLWKRRKRPSPKTPVVNPVENIDSLAPEEPARTLRPRRSVVYAD